jgi:NAD(P)H dehydrogenase (quinone)
MILVTGSTGTFGSHVAKALQQQKTNFKAAGRGSEKINELLGKGISFAKFDWENPHSFENLFNEITEIYLVSPPNSNSFPEQVVPFLKKAKEKGVKFIALSTVFGTEANKEGALYKTELAVQNSGIDYAIMRPNFIFQNFINYDLGAVKSGSIYLPSGDGKTSYIDVRDVAEVIVEILKNSKNHSRKIYNITGSEALNHEAAAKIFTEVLRTEVKNINPTEAEYKHTLTSYNLPEATVDFMAMLYSFIKAGYFTTITHDFENITGRKPKTFKDFVSDYKAVFINS